MTRLADPVTFPQREVTRYPMPWNVTPSGPISSRVRVMSQAASPTAKNRMAATSQTAIRPSGSVTASRMPIVMIETATSGATWRAMDLTRNVRRMGQEPSASTRRGLASETLGTSGRRYLTLRRRREQNRHVMSVVRLRELLPRAIAVAMLPLTVIGLVVGLLASWAGNEDLARLAWTVPAVVVGLRLAWQVLRDLLDREAGVDIIALLAIAGALAVGESLAAAIIAVMLATGEALEDYAQGRAKRELTALLARAPQQVTRYVGNELEVVPVAAVAPGDSILVRPGEVVPVDGVVTGAAAVLDESALTGEARLVTRAEGDHVASGVVNGGSPFDLRATATAEASTYAGIVRLVRQASRSKAPFVRLADRYGLLFVPLTLAIAGVAWLVSGDPIRALAVLVVATPCPLILAVPIAIVSGISRAARRGIIVKGGGPLETIARARVILFDKTGTLTAGQPRLASIEGPGDPDELLRVAGSLEQASPHVLAEALVAAAPITRRGPARAVGRGGDSGERRHRPGGRARCARGHPRARERRTAPAPLGA